MRLISKIIIKIKTGFLQHLINEVYKRNCGVKNISLIESGHGTDLFHIEIIYTSIERYKDLLNKITKYEENFQVISTENLIENEISGGMLNVTGKLRFDNLIDYEMNVLGAAELIFNKLQEKGNILQYSGISRNIGMFCGITAGEELEEKHLKLYTIAERDSIIAKKFTGFNSFPLLVKLSQFDDFVKILIGVVSTFSAIRIINLEDIDDITLYERLYDDISLPLLSHCYDEIPLYLLIAIVHLLTKNSFNIKTCTVGLIGISTSSLRITRLLVKLGFPRILGYDNNLKFMHSFEREGGLATTHEHIYENSDLIIIFKDQFDSDELYRFGTGQIIISLLNKDLETSVMKEKGVRDFLQSGWMDNFALFPGLLKGLIESNVKFLDDAKIIKLSQKIGALKGKDEILPDVFSEVHQKLPDLIREL
jgi:malate dehydrogenase (oxaloacetate-decarboxylating)